MIEALIIYIIGLVITPFVASLPGSWADDGSLVVVAVFWPLFLLAGIAFLALLPFIKLAEFIVNIVNK